MTTWHLNKQHMTSSVFGDRHPGGYLPQRTAHSTSDCEDWSSSAPPGKMQLFHSCGSDKENSKLDTAVDVSSFRLFNCEAQRVRSVNSQVWDETAQGTRHFTGDRLIIYKGPPDERFIHTLTIKGIRSRQLAKVKAYLVWWFFLHWGHCVHLCVFPVFNV